MMKVTLFVLLAIFGLSGTAAADDHGTTWRGVNLAQNFGVQFEVCALNPGKTMADVARLDNRVKAAWANMNIDDLQLLRLAPMYTGTLPSQPQTDYINLVMGDISALGAGWDAWMASKEGPKILSDVQKIADCRFKFGRGINKMIDTKALDSTDNRIMTFNWCEPKDGVSYEQIKAKHDSWLADNGESFTAAAWNVIDPRQGAGTRQGMFMHMVSYTSVSQLMANENWIANGGGWRGIQDYLTSYAQCEGESAWTAEYIIKTGG